MEIFVKRVNQFSCLAFMGLAVLTAGCDGDKNPTSSSSSSSSSSTGRGLASSSSSSSSSSTSSSNSSTSSSNSSSTGSSSSTTSSGHVIYNPNTPLRTTLSDIPSDFRYTDIEGRGIGIPARRKVFNDDVCTSSTGRILTTAKDYYGVGYFDFDKNVKSRLDYARVLSSGSPRNGESITFHYSNGTQTALSVQLWVNGGLLVESLEFPPTGSWSTWKSLTIDGAINQKEIQVSLLAKTALGGPHIDTTTVHFSYDCQWECGASATELGSCPAQLPGI